MLGGYGVYGQIVGGSVNGVTSAAAAAVATGGVSPIEEFAFTDEEQGRFNWIVPATDLPWIGAFRFLPAPGALSTTLISVSDTSGVALAQCVAPRGMTDAPCLLA